MEFQEVIQRLRKGQRIREIHTATGIHRTIIRELKCLAQEHGWLEAESAPCESTILEARRRGERQERESHALTAFEPRIKEWLAEGYSCVVIHRLIQDRYRCSEATVRRFIHKQFPQQIRATVTRVTVAGRDMEVDFGYLGVCYDPQSRRNRKTWLFSARLRHSRLAWREATFDQKAITFFRAHMNAFEYFMGVPANVIPDNLKAAVLKASHTDPLISRAYRGLAEHYGFMICACPPREPRKKGGVENDVKYVKNNFWPVFKETQKAKGYQVPRYDELQEQLGRWSREVSEARVVRGVGRSPREIFETEERAALLKLPATRWDPLSWAQAKVAPDFRVQFQKGFYTVPYEHIGRTVVVCGDSHTVRIFLNLKEIAAHQRVEKPWQTRYNPLHAPPNMGEYLSTTREGLIQWAARIAEPVERVAQLILSDKAVDGIRPVRALLRLSTKFSAQRLAAACRRALRYDSPSYSSVKNILLKNLDLLSPEAPIDSSGQQVFRFARRGVDFDPLSYSQN
jgi:transposase